MFQKIEILAISVAECPRCARCFKQIRTAGSRTYAHLANLVTPVVGWWNATLVARVALRCVDVLQQPLRRVVSGACVRVVSVSGAFCHVLNGCAQYTMTRRATMFCDV